MQAVSISIPWINFKPKTKQKLHQLSLGPKHFALVASQHPSQLTEVRLKQDAVGVTSRFSAAERQGT